MTNKEILIKIKTMAETANETEITDWCDKQIASIDRAAIKAKEKAEKKKLESDELKEKIYNILLTKEEPITADDIAAEINEEGISKQKIIARLTRLFVEGKIEKELIKIEGAKNKRTGYKAKEEEA